MAILSLRATISALSALSVAAVAAITLSITLTTSLSALRSIGQTHATSLLLNPLLQTEQLFHRPVIAFETIGNVTRSHAWNWPSDDPSMYAMYRTMVLDQYLACEGYCTVNTMLADSTNIQVNSYTNDIYSGYIVSGAPYSKGGLAYQRTQPVNIERFAGYWANHTSPPSTDPVFNQTISPILIAGSVVWQRLVNGNTSSVPTFRGVIPTPGLVNRYSVVLFAKMFNANKTLFTATIISLDLASIEGFLKDITGTPHTSMFAYDGTGLLLGTNQGKPYSTSFSINLSYVPPPGCQSNIGFTDFNNGMLFGWCRDHISKYGYPPLAKIAADGMAFGVGQSVGMFTVDGDIYYYAIAQVSLKYNGTGVWLALLLPESDVIGDVVTGRNTAIGVTCGVFVLVAAATFVAISWLLSPLTTIADRMMLAATLEDNAIDDGTDRSAMAEVQDLQDAYCAMNQELNRIKSFVPKTVLHNLRETEDEDADLTVSVKDNTSEASSRRSAQSKRRSNPASHLDCGLAVQSVTVVSGDMDGFDSAIHSVSREAVVDRMGQTVQLVHATAAAHRGVVQSFHGDHFVVTFNAVSPCAAHARRGAAAALDLTSNASEVGIKLTVRAGVATGRCLVGNLGSHDAKAFNTIGAAFVQAGLLQRMTREYGATCRVLATPRTCVDITTHLRTLYVDVVPLPSAPVLIGAVLGVARLADSGANQGAEWLYIVGDSNPMTKLEDAINNAFVCLADGRHEECAAIVASHLDGVDTNAVETGLQCHLMTRLLDVRKSASTKQESNPSPSASVP